MPKATKQLLPTGSRKQFSRGFVEALAKAPREMIREKFLPKLDKYCEVVISLMEQGDRTGIHSYERGLGVATDNEELADAILARLGITGGMTAAERIAMRHREAESVDEAQLWRISEAFCQDYRRRNGLPLLVEGKPVEAPGEVQ